MCNCCSRIYTVGETHQLDWEIKPNNRNDIVVVTAARYEILKSNSVIESGSAKIDGLKISCLFSAKEKGCYTVRIFVTVPPETVSAELEIDVTE